MKVERALPPLLLLAAGLGRRMGTLKSLVEIPGYVGLSEEGSEPLISWQLRRYFDAGGTAAVVVLGEADARVDAVLPPHRSYSGRVLVVRNLRPESGAFASIQIGLEEIFQKFPGISGCFVLPVDVPAPSRDSWQSLFAALIPDVSADVWVVRPVFSQKRGHPVLISQRLFPEILKLQVSDQEARLDRLIGRCPSHQVADVAVEDLEVGLNLNRPEDVQDWFRRWRH